MFGGLFVTLLRSIIQKWRGWKLCHKRRGIFMLAILRSSDMLKYQTYKVYRPLDVL